MHCSSCIRVARCAEILERQGIAQWYRPFYVYFHRPNKTKRVIVKTPTVLCLGGVLGTRKTLFRSFNTSLQNYISHCVISISDAPWTRYFWITYILKLLLHTANTIQILCVTLDWVSGYLATSKGHRRISINIFSLFLPIYHARYLKFIWHSAICNRTILAPNPSK